jgi:hypothetical protein
MLSSVCTSDVHYHPEHTHIRGIYTNALNAQSSTPTHFLLRRSLRFYTLDRPYQLPGFPVGSVYTTILAVVATEHASAVIIVNVDKTI